MNVVIDGTALTDHLRGDGNARTGLLLLMQSGDRIASSVLSRLEVLAAMPPWAEHETRALLDAVHWVEVDEEVTQRAASYAEEHRLAHPAIQPTDYVLAATARLLRGDMWTRRVEMFPMFPGLRSPY